MVRYAFMSSSTLETPILEMKDVSFRYGKRLVLDRVSFSVQSNDFYIIIGPNGGGKSTLAKLILGYHQPNSGSISLFGKPVKQGRIHVGYCPQYSAVDYRFPISTFDGVMMGRMCNKLFFRPSKEDQHATQEAMERVNVWDLRNRAIEDLSGGQLQRVFLARALVNSPKFLVLDEALSQVDVHAENHFFDVLSQISKHVAILMITHDLSAIARSATKIGCLNTTFIAHDQPILHKGDLEQTYGCDIDLIAHGVPHRLLGCHHD